MNTCPTRVSRIETLIHMTSFLVLIVLLVFLVLPENLLAADSNRSSTAGGGALAFWLICYLARKYPIGGWLLMYFISLYSGFVISIIMTIISFQNYNPLQWDSILHYLIFLITTVPGDFILLIQVYLSFSLLSESRRDWKHIETLKTVLFLNIIFSLFSIPFDLTLWPDNVIISVYSAVVSLIWFSYFKKSARVKYVFKEKNWDWALLNPPKVVS